MGLITSVLGLGLGMAAISAAAEGSEKKAYPKLDKNQFDAENARYGIRGPSGFDDERIKKIAARCGVTPNKAGILPEQGYVMCISYVEQYLNDDTDIPDFEHAWVRAVQHQILEKQSKARATINPKYEIAKDLVENNIMKDAEPIILEYKHWHGIPKKEHLKRMNELMDKTFWGLYCKEPPILRDNPRMQNSYTETWIMYPLPGQKQGGWSTERSFKNHYKLCCERLGYEDGF